MIAHKEDESHMRGLEGMEMKEPLSDHLRRVFDRAKDLERGVLEEEGRHVSRIEINAGV